MAQQEQTQGAPLPDPFTLIWRWLNSLPIAIGVMLALAILSALGTVIPQEHLAQPPAGMNFDQMLIERFGDMRAGLVKTLGLHHIYFTWYFFVLLVWLSISAVVCNYTRWKRTMRLWRMPADNQPRHFAGKRALSSENASVEQVDALLGELKDRRFRVRKVHENGVLQVYADQGFWKLWGLMLLHVAVLVLIFGGVYGKIVGVEGMVALADGEEKTVAMSLAEHKHPFVQPLLRNVAPLEYRLSQDHFRIDYDKKIALPEMITEHVPPDLQDYYRYFVKDYVSDLTVESLRTGQVREQQVTVNHPLIVDKLNIYQSSYQQRGYLLVEIDGEEREYVIPPGGALLVAADGCFVESMGAWFSLAPDDNFVAASPASPAEGVMVVCEQVKAGDLYVGGESQGFLGPLTIITTAFSGGMGPRQIITPDQSAELLLGGGTVAKVRMSPRVDNTSIFSYKRDPGIPILYLGWIAMIIGITLALYIPYSQVRLRVEDGRAALRISGAGGKPDAPLRRRLHDILCPS